MRSRCRWRSHGLNACVLVCGCAERQAEVLLWPEYRATILRGVDSANQKRMHCELSNNRSTVRPQYGGCVLLSILPLAHPTIKSALRVGDVITDIKAQGHENEPTSSFDFMFPSLQVIASRLCELKSDPITIVFRREPPVCV